MTTNDTKIGILIVGLGGNNGVTLLAGHIAHAKGLNWESASRGPLDAATATWKGCITQPQGETNTSCPYSKEYNLALASKAAIGGWDIRSTPLGDALYDCKVVDYDLVRKVRDEMNAFPIMKGVYNAEFLGESQHATATHIVNPVVDGTTTSYSYSWMDLVNSVRKDIQTFKAEQGVTGHTTVIWSASVEVPADIEETLKIGEDLIKAIVENNRSVDISPSMIYAVASALEGCSFVNGGSQNTLTPCMSDLFQLATTKRDDAALWSGFDSLPTTTTTTQPAYLLGTDFKAGQTKFKTAAVEYIRALGLTPMVIASSNHLGNNDMLNLTSKKTVTAKMRVKSNIFGPWKEDQLDHKVAVMYTPYIADEKRDVVEYTSLGFLSSPHTMLTYTRCMDSILCVPLMVDVAVWCDYFASKQVSPEKVAKATAYLFKVPEGGAKGVDPGFFAQMKALDSILKDTANGGDALAQAVEKGIITVEQANAIRALST